MLGFVLIRKNITLMLISVEVMLLVGTLLGLISSTRFDDVLGQTYSVSMIAIAGVESSIGLKRLIRKTMYLTILGFSPLGAITAGFLNRKIG